MNNIAPIIKAFQNTEIDFSQLEKKLIEEVVNGTPIFQIESIIDSPSFTSVFSKTERVHLRIALKKVISDDRTVIKVPEGVDDKTIIKNVNDDQTVIASQTSATTTTTTTPAAINSNDETVIASAIDSTIVSTVFTETASTKDTASSTTDSALDSMSETLVTNISPPQSGSNRSIKLEPGQIINNRFVLEKLLGRGGMGSVFKARDLRKEEANDSNSHIAIKFLNDDFKQHPQALISLQREAKKSQTLAHPNIITVHDFDRDGDTVYMTMEYLDGLPLDEYLAENKHTGIEKAAALKMLEDMSQALAYAHEKNIVHSDFKPGNIFITKEGRAKVLDFGIARAVKNISDSGNDESTDKTHFDAGDLGGLTPTYASCEMLEGKQPSPSDDIYALGCVAYELFTGAHPFLKKRATQARDSGLSPDIIKTLDKKQSNALFHALQFSMDARTQDAQTFINEFFIRKQSSKGLLTTLAIAAIIIIAVGIKFFIDYQQQIANEQLVNNIQQNTPSIIANAIPTLNALTGETRENILTEVRPIIIQYYADKALPLADQSKGKYNFPSALSILSDAKKLYPDSAQLNDLYLQLIKNQNQLLNTLATQFDKYLQKGNLTSAVANNDIKSIIDLLNIAAPDSHLLKDPRIHLAYVREIKAALKADDLSNAKTLMTSALSIFSNNKDLSDLNENIKEREAQTIEDLRLVELQKQLRENGKKVSEKDRKKALERHTQKLAALVKQGFREKKWLSKVQSQIIALNTFAKTTKEKQLALRDKAATLVVQKARKLRRDNQLTEASSLLKQATKIAPTLSTVKREKRALTIAERKQQTTHANKEKTAKITTLRKSLLNQAKADDVKNAVKTYKQLKKIDPKSRFTRTEATDSIANAYLRLAKGLASRGNFRSAVTLANSAMEIAPQYIPAKNKKREYLAEIAIIDLENTLTDIESLNAGNSEKLLSTIKRGLPDRFNAIQQKSANQLIKRIKQLATSNQDQAKITIDIAQQIFPNNKEIAALTKRSSDFQSAGGQPCKTSYASHGKRTRATCFDMLTPTVKAPLLVVIPAVNSSKIYAISKYEISIKEFNEYCKLTRKCSSIKNSDQELPITNISIAEMKAYARWLSDKTQQQYSLPTDQQWLHAAKAKGTNTKNDMNCRLMLGDKQIKGKNLLNTQSGQHNAWGLKNHVGNAQELVTQGNKVFARGGAYTDSYAQCDITLKRKHSGQKDKITGFRIARVL